MSLSDDIKLNECGCCEGEAPLAPLYNRPALPALSYRIATFATFLKRMSGKIGLYVLPDGPNAGTRPLEDLSTRSPDDPAMALLDAAAVVGDVLTFYQERVANEGFLRTATERRSVLELARAIGYELSPGVAASTYLAFTVDDAPGAPGKAEVALGTRVQSMPEQGQLPQTFETIETIQTRTAWNALRPRLTQKQDLTGGIAEIHIKGTDAGLAVGDVLLIVAGDQSAPVRVARVVPDFDNKRTRVVFSKASSPLSPAILGPPAAWFSGKIPLNDTSVQMKIIWAVWTDKDLNAFLTENEWDRETLLDYVSNYRAEFPDVLGELHTMRVRVGMFGNNALKYSSLPASMRIGEYVRDKNGTYVSVQPSYASNWEGTDITRDSQGNSLTSAHFYLERPLPEIKAGSWIVLEGTTAAAAARGYEVDSAVESARSDFGLAARTTGIKVKNTTGLTNFIFRDTTAYVQSQELALVEKPLPTVLARDMVEIELNSLVLDLRAGQMVILTGERFDARGLVQSEALEVEEICHKWGYTTLTFKSGLQYDYVRATVGINANVARATHGETTTEILGAGDRSLPNQKFVLKKPPLTYVQAATQGGSRSTLEVRVNNLLWDEAPSLYELAPRDERFAVRLDDDGNPQVIFGDGERGARLPTGPNNIVARYRSGTGLAGEVGPDRLSVLQSRPLGIKDVTNPLPATGAGNPEKIDDARTNAPLTVRTLDRIVSLQDYEDFALSFAGIGKAQSVPLWIGEDHLVHLTVATESGKQVDSKLKNNLVQSIDMFRYPNQRYKVDGFQTLLFEVKAGVVLNERYIAQEVLAVIEARLQAHFSFANRSFGQSVTAAESIALIQSVEGVVAVDLDALYITGQIEKLNQVLPAERAHYEAGAVQLAQLLLINPPAIKLTEVEP